MTFKYSQQKKSEFKKNNELHSPISILNLVGFLTPWLLNKEQVRRTFGTYISSYFISLFLNDAETKKYLKQYGI